VTFATILLVLGSIRCTEEGFVPAIQIASLVTSAQSAVSPILNVAVGRSEEMELELPSRPASQYSVLLREPERRRHNLSPKVQGKP
jgi:hypothetical protein